MLNLEIDKSYVVPEIECKLLTGSSYASYVDVCSIYISTWRKMRKIFLFHAFYVSYSKVLDSIDQNMRQLTFCYRSATQWWYYKKKILSLPQFCFLNTCNGSDAVYLLGYGLFTLLDGMGKTKLQLSMMSLCSSEVDKGISVWLYRIITFPSCFW